MELSASKPEQSEQIFSIIFDKDEITWQTIIYELINKGEIDPWDVDISVLTKRYIDSIFGKETEKQEALARWF